MKRVKIIDVAKEVGVSKSTISNYLNNRFESMSEETKEKIRDAIEKLNYSPNIGARSLASKGNLNTICLIIPHNISYAFSTEFFAKVMKGIGDIVEKLNYRTMIFACQRHKMEDDIEYIKSLGTGLVDGFLVFDINENDLFIRELEKSNIPYVCFGKFTDEPNAKYVASDHEKGAYDAISYFIKHGHERIAIFTDPEELMVVKQRIKGYSKAYKNHNLSIDNDLIVYLQNDSPDIIQNVYQNAKRLFDLDNPPTAFYISYNHLEGFHKARKEKEKSIPQDISLILCEYFPKSYISEYDYSYVETYVYNLAVAAVKKLMKLIHKKDIEVTPELLPVKLIIGETCGDNLIK